MTKTTNKTNEIKNRIKQHRAMIDSLRIQLKETETNKHYGATKGGFLKTIKALTSPFASYNKKVAAYLEDPELFQLEKSVLKLQNYCLKIAQKKDSLNTWPKIVKTIGKLNTLEQEVITNPAFITERYPDYFNVKETLEEVNLSKQVFEELKAMIVLCNEAGMMEPNIPS